DAATVPEVTDSGIFEFKPSTDNAVPAESDEPEDAATVPEVTDSGLFELKPAPSDTHGDRKGDEWEIGWEPEDDGAAAEFDVSGDAKTRIAAPSAGVEAATETPPPAFTKIAHVCLYVKDLTRSVDFYSKLGFQKRFVFNRNGNLFGAYLEFGDGNFIELFEDVSRSAVAALGRLAHFCLETPDIDAAMESLSARRIGFSPKKLGCDSTYQIWLKDPDGNEFEIHQYTENSSQLVGGEVEADW
ncbi:MAG: VOC family protein, partial [Chitinispirillales bacterium]|nr:VOC family protein [Chitinispirillales bacterium]